MATKANELQTVEQILKEKDREATIINVIARAASDPNTDVDKLERLLAMQERVLEREAERLFNAAMREAFVWPVHRDYFCCSAPMAVFDTWGEAADYAMRHDLFMGDPVRRAA